MPFDKKKTNGNEDRDVSLYSRNNQKYHKQKKKYIS